MPNPSRYRGAAKKPCQPGMHVVVRDRERAIFDCMHCDWHITKEALDRGHASEVVAIIESPEEMVSSVKLACPENKTKPLYNGLIDEQISKAVVHTFKKQDPWWWLLFDFIASIFAWLPRVSQLRAENKRLVMENERLLKESSHQGAYR